MSKAKLDEDTIIDNIKFLIKYCDLYVTYCHNENLSIDGDTAAEIYDEVIKLEEFIDNRIVLDNIDTIKKSLNTIYDLLNSLNDIKLFNGIHIVFKEVINEIE